MCVGVDYGPVLRLTDDAYGDHVNIAFKIGEGLARRGEVLVTERVASELRATETTYIRTERLGDADVKLYRVGPAGERTSALAPPAERG